MLARTLRRGIERTDVGHLAMVIPDDIHQRAKAQAAYKGQSFKDWVIAALEAEAARQEAERLEQRRR